MMYGIITYIYLMVPGAMRIEGTFERRLFERSSRFLANVLPIAFFERQNFTTTSTSSTVSVTRLVNTLRRSKRERPTLTIDVAKYTARAAWGTISSRPYTEIKASCKLV
jgi:hypothetical protein